MTKQWMVVASMLMTLAACGGSAGPDESNQSDVWHAMCRQSGDAFDVFVAQQLDSGDSRETVRAHVQDTCPERNSDLAAAFAGLDSVKDACSIPKSERDDSQERLAEAMGC